MAARDWVGVAAYLNARQDALNTDIPAYVFFWHPFDPDCPCASDGLLCCGCYEMAEHWDNCPATLIYAQLYDELDDGLAGWPWGPETWNPGTRMNWYCRGTVDDVDHPHKLGEINGPAHWCEARKQVVDLHTNDPCPDDWDTDDD